MQANAHKCQGQTQRSLHTLHGNDQEGREDPGTQPAPRTNRHVFITPGRIYRSIDSRLEQATLVGEETASYFNNRATFDGAGRENKSQEEGRAGRGTRRPGEGWQEESLKGGGRSCGEIR